MLRTDLCIAVKVWCFLPFSICFDNSGGLSIIVLFYACFLFDYLSIVGHIGILIPVKIFFLVLPCSVSLSLFFGVTIVRNRIFGHLLGFPQYM